MQNAENASRRSFLIGWCDEAPPEIRKRYTRNFLLALAAYMILLFISIPIVRTHPDAPWRFAAALVPMIPMIYMVQAYLWYLRRLDEMQRQIHLEGLAIGFAGTAVTTFGYGFLQTVGLPDVSWFMVWPLMSLFWTVGHIYARRRYR